jgi:hypothetical protein
MTFMGDFIGGSWEKLKIALPALRGRALGHGKAENRSSVGSKLWFHP